MFNVASLLVGFVALVTLLGLRVGILDTVQGVSCRFADALLFILRGLAEGGDQVRRVAPGVQFLAAAGRHQLGDDGRQHGGGVLPAVWGLLRGERPSALALAGVGVAFVAAAIVGRGAESDPAVTISPRLELALGAGAGVGFGVVFILLAESSSGSGMWPVFIARCASVPVLAVAAVVLGRSPRMARADIAPVAGAGLCDVGANALVVLAVRRGLLSLVAPVASLYPATTVVLARFVLHERIGRQRAGGLALGLVGLALIATR